MPTMRFRLRTLMLIVAFVALGLVVFLQAIYINRAEMRMQALRDQALRARAIAEHQLVAAEQQLASARELLALEELRANARASADQAKPAQTKNKKQP